MRNFVIKVLLFQEVFNVIAHDVECRRRHVAMVVAVEFVDIDIRVPREL